MFHWRILSNIKKKNLTPTLHNLLQKMEEETLTSSFYESSITLMPKSDKQYKNRKLQANLFHEFKHRLLKYISKLKTTMYKENFIMSKWHFFFLRYARLVQQSRKKINIIPKKSF